MRKVRTPEFNIDKAQRTAALLEAAREPDADYHALGKRFGLSFVTVHRICGEAGIPTPQERKRAANIARAAALRAEGRSQTEIARALGLSQTYIGVLLRNQPVAPEEPKVRRCPGYQRGAHECPENDFYRDNKRSRVGFSYYCRECHKARSRAYFREKYYPAHRADLIAAVIRRRARAKAQKEGELCPCR